MLSVEFTVQFRKDYKRALKRGLSPEKLKEVVSLLCNEQALPDCYRDHAFFEFKELQGCQRMPH